MLRCLVRCCESDAVLHALSPVLDGGALLYCRPSLTKTLFRAFWYRLTVGAILQLVVVLLQLTPPIFCKHTSSLFATNEQLGTSSVEKRAMLCKLLRTISAESL